MTGRPKPPEGEAPERATMAQVVVEKDKLLAALKENREAHRALFEAALDGYKAKAIELLEEHIERIRGNKVERVYVQLPIPEDHTKDYDLAISTLEWTVFGQVQLGIADFDRYVNDNWAWKQEFTASTQMYAVGVSQ